MQRTSALTAILVAVLGGIAARAEEVAPALSPNEVVISVADQKLVLLRDGMRLAIYKVSTSKFGAGDSYGSYKTPLGKLRVCDRVGESLPCGSVIKHRNATGEILPVNAPGRDPIVTRIVWLDGLEEQNKNARARGIYIHGTVEEAKIGEAVSYGCIRMKSREVMELFDQVPVGTLVTIQAEKLAKYKRWTPPPPVIIAAAKPATKPAATPAPDTKPPAPLLASHPTPQPRPEEIPARPTAADSLKKKSDASGEFGAAESMKGSILFADLPGHGTRPSTPLESVRGPVLEPVGEAPRSSLQTADTRLPKLSFRTTHQPEPNAKSVAQRVQ